MALQNVAFAEGTSILSADSRPKILAGEPGACLGLYRPRVWGRNPSYYRPFIVTS